MKQNLAGFVGARCCSVALLIIFFSTAVFSAGAWTSQNNNKKKKKSNAPDATVPAPPLPATSQIEHNIGEMLAAFEVGDADTMHKYYSDDVTIVRAGAYEAPIVGYANYALEYKRDIAAFEGIQILRRNTLIFTRPDVAWATYQWEFHSTASGKAFSAEGETTLVFNKVGDNWLIIHNHTSQICSAAPAPTQTPVGTKAPGL